MKATRLCLLLFCLVISVGFVSIAEATTINAASCSRTDVDAAINTTPAVDGDTVVIPAGTCTWTTTVTVTNKSITIQGTGTAGTEAQCTGGQTTFTCITASLQALAITTKATGITQLKNFTVWGTAPYTNCQGAYGNASIVIAGPSANVRVTGMVIIYGHATLASCGGIVTHNIRGVIDHNAFYGHNGLAHAIASTHDSWNGVGNYGDNSWAQSSSMGTVDNLFVEDNTFDSDHVNTVNVALDPVRGSRIVARFNTATRQQFQSHGTETDGRNRGIRHFEVYRNRFNWIGSNGITMIALRGGTGRLFDNVATGIMNTVVDFNSYRANPGFSKNAYYTWAYCRKQTVTITRSGSTATVTSPLEHGVWSTGSYITISGADQAEYNGVKTSFRVGSDTAPSTQFTYTVSGTPATPATGTIIMQATFDGNTENTGYPCIDQLGRGQGDLISGEAPGGGDTITPKAWPNQVLDPLYIWNNTDDGVLSSGQPSASADVIIELRDYYNQNNSFNGTTQHGIGRGVRSSRPASCTTGDAWWATNGGGNWNTSTTETYSSTPGEDGGLDLCTGTNTWTNDSYVPYAYPHPLVSGVVAPLKRFSPGINLRRADLPNDLYLVHQ